MALPTEMTRRWRIPDLLAGSGYLADIGLPASIFAELGVDADGLFAAGPLLRLV